MLCKVLVLWNFSVFVIVILDINQILKFEGKINMVSMLL